MQIIHIALWLHIRIPQDIVKILEGHGRKMEPVKNVVQKKLCLIELIS